MFWSNKRSQKKLIELEIMKLEQHKHTLQQEKLVLEQAIVALKQEHTKEITSAVEHFQFAMDFGKMNAFSVERIVKDGKGPHTIVGYFITHGNGTTEVKEWMLYTSAKEHNRMVAEFELWKAKQS